MPTDQIRLLVVEDVPQVAQYMRGLVSASPRVKLLDILRDGRDVMNQVVQQRPDVVVVDALLQGRIGGLDLAAQLRHAGLPPAIVVITVPQRPVIAAPDRGIDAVLAMPFTGYELITLLQSAFQAQRDRDPSASAMVIGVFAPKGGVGKTTLALNLAVALQQHMGVRTVLIDGSLQFGDLRALLKVAADAPSILDLPTDRIQESDLADVLWRDPSGIDILLAPPRIEMADMVTARDVEKVLSLLRRVYDASVVDLPTGLGDLTLAFLDASDVVLQVVTYDSTTLRNTVSVGETFRAIGYPASKIQYVLNRADWSGGLDPGVLRAAIGREPDHTVVSDGRLVTEANNQGVPFVLATPDAEISADVRRMAEGLMPSRRLAVARA
ncbi:MAG TPA: AAA family ATPase [Candidatus Acidoferrales bacterium]|nr:AAA family ATPase [Candidatus Acidoferrales bacterium]